VALVICLLFSTVAVAQNAEKRANDLYNEGKTLMQQGDVQGAIEQFGAAWASFQHPLIIKKRAEAHETLFQFEEAIADYRTFLKKARRLKKGERNQLKAQIAGLEEALRVPVKVTITTAPEGVIVKVDGGVEQFTPFILETTPGKHMAAILDMRYMSMSSEIRVLATKPNQVLKVQAIPKTGKVVFTTDRNDFSLVKLFLDSTVIKLSPLELNSNRSDPRQIVMGSHELLCSFPQLPSYYTRFEVVGGQESEVKCDFAAVPSGMWRDSWGWVTLGSGMVGIVAGSALLISYSVDQETAKSSNKELITSKDTAGYVLLGLGAVLSVSSYFVFTRYRRSAQGSRQLRPTWTLLPLSDGAFLSAHLRF
jgi:hypothetical protein